MIEAKQSSSLFDTRDVWANEPLFALEALLKSGDYLLTGKPRGYHGAQRDDAQLRPPTLGDDSIKVYRAMFGKFLAAIDEAGCPSLIDVSETEIAQFFEGPSLATAKKDTFNRYRRLLERVFDYLVAKGFIMSNPVTTWLEGFKAQHENRKPEDSKPTTAPDIVDQATVQRLREWLQALGRRAEVEEDWRTLRNVVAAMLAIGAGIRAKELQLLKAEQFTIRPEAEPGQKVEITINNHSTVRTAQAHRVMVDSLCEDLLLAWYEMRFTSGIKPIANATTPALVVPGDTIFIGIGREQGAKALGKPGALSVSYFNRALKRLAKEAVAQFVIREADMWLLSRGAQGLRRAYTLVELQGKAAPADLRLKLGLHLEVSVKKYEHQLKARVRVPRLKV